MSADEDGTPRPKSMRHQRILDLAAEQPDASVDDLAAAVPSATPELVESVFETHGDPAAEATTDSEDTMAATNGHTSGEKSPESTTAEQPGSAAEEYPDRSELSERSRALVDVVAAHPEATQAELAEHFDVTRATVSRWAAEIEGLEWADRAEFAAAVVEEPPEVALESADVGEQDRDASDSAEAEPETEEADRASDGPAASTDLESELAALQERVSALEEAGGGGASAFEDPALVQKIAHACLEADAITEAEERRILEALLS